MTNIEITWLEIIFKIWKLKRIIILAVIGITIGTIWGILIVIKHFIVYGEIRYDIIGRD